MSNGPTRAELAAALAEARADARAVKSEVAKDREAKAIDRCVQVFDDMTGRSPGGASAMSGTYRPIGGVRRVLLYLADRYDVDLIDRPVEHNPDGAFDA